MLVRYQPCFFLLGNFYNVVDLTCQGHKVLYNILTSLFNVLFDFLQLY